MAPTSLTAPAPCPVGRPSASGPDRKSTRLNSSHGYISYAVFCLKKKKNRRARQHARDAHGLQPAVHDARDDDDLPLRRADDCRPPPILRSPHDPGPGTVLSPPET